MRTCGRRSNLVAPLSQFVVGGQSGDGESIRRIRFEPVETNTRFDDVASAVRATVASYRIANDRRPARRPARRRTPRERDEVVTRFDDSKRRRRCRFYKIARTRKPFVYAYVQLNRARRGKHLRVVCVLVVRSAHTRRNFPLTATRQTL